MGTLALSNPTNHGIIKMWGFIAISIFIVGNLWILFEDGFSWLGITVGAIVSFFIFMMVPGKLELIDRPRSVEVTDTGVILHQKLGRKSVFVPWSEISRISHAVVEPSERNWNTVDSFLGVSDNKRYTLNWKIAEVIRESYRNKMGRYPPNRMEDGGT